MSSILKTSGDFKRRLLLGATMVGSLWSLNTSAATLTEAIQFAVDTHPDITQATASRRATDEELNQAKGLYYPQADLEVSTGPEWIYRNRSDWNDPEWTNQLTLTVKEGLLDRYRTTENIRQEARVNAAAVRVRERVEVVSLDVVQSYLDVMRQREIIALAKDNLSAHNETLQKVRQRFSGGQSGVGDVQQAQARYANARSTLTQAKRDLDDAEITYHRIVGRYPKNLFRPAFKEALLPEDISHAVRTAVEDSPSLAVTAADLDVAQTDIMQSKSNFWPTINAEVASTYLDNVNGITGERRDTTALLVLRYNLYRGGIDTAAKREMIRRRDQAIEAYRGLVRQVEEEVRLSWTAIARTRQKRQALEAEEKANSDVVTTYRQEFDIGQRSLLNLLDSETELFNAKVNRLTAQYSELYAKYRLLASMGRLAPSLGVSTPPSAFGTERQTDFHWQATANEAARATLIKDSEADYAGVLSLTGDTDKLPPEQDPEAAKAAADTAADLNNMATGSDPLSIPAGAVTKSDASDDPFAIQGNGNDSGTADSAAPDTTTDPFYIAPQQGESGAGGNEITTDTSGADTQPAEDNHAGGWLVMVAPQANYEAATKVVSDLISVGIDAFVLLKGEYRYGVSTGLFRDKKNAGQLADRVKEHGYDTQIVPWPM